MGMLTLPKVCKSQVRKVLAHSTNINPANFLCVPVLKLYIDHFYVNPQITNPQFLWCSSPLIANLQIFTIEQRG